MREFFMEINLIKKQNQEITWTIKLWKKKGHSCPHVTV